MFPRTKFSLGQKILGDNMFPGQNFPRTTFSQYQMFPWTKCFQDKMFTGMDNIFPGQKVPVQKSFTWIKCSHGFNGSRTKCSYDMFLGTKCSLGQNVPRDTKFLGRKTVPKNICSGSNVPNDTMFTMIKCSHEQNIPGTKFSPDQMFSLTQCSQGSNVPWTKCSRTNLLPWTKCSWEKMFLSTTCSWGQNVSWEQHIA